MSSWARYSHGYIRDVQLRPGLKLVVIEVQECCKQSGAHQLLAVKSFLTSGSRCRKRGEEQRMYPSSEDKRRVLGIAGSQCQAVNWQPDRSNWGQQMVLEIVHALAWWFSRAEKKCRGVTPERCWEENRDSVNGRDWLGRAYAVQSAREQSKEGKDFFVSVAFRIRVQMIGG